MSPFGGPSAPKTQDPTFSHAAPVWNSTEDLDVFIGFKAIPTLLLLVTYIESMFF